MNQPLLRRPAVVGAAAGALAFVWFVVLALARWNEGRATSYDLGIFSQAAQQWSRGNLPRAFIRGDHTLLADHFSPATAVFGVAWRIWPDPRVLLLTQALFLAVGVAIMVGTALARLGVRAAAVVLLAGLASKAMVAGDLFDVHEVALAVPLTAVLVWAFLERRFRWAVVACLLLVLVKEDLGLTVGVAGILWWWRAGRDRKGLREGLVLCVIGAVGLVLALVVIGHFNPSGHTSYLDYFTGGSSGDLAAHSEPPVHELALDQRIVPLFMLAVATLVIGARSSLLWLAAPTIAWRVLSSNASYWSSDNHYDLVLWPIAIGAAIEAWPRWSVQPRRALVAAGLVVSAIASVGFIADRGVNPLSAFSRDAKLDALDQLMSGVPHGSKVAAQNSVGPYLIPRYDVTMLGVDRPERVAYAVLVDDDKREFQAQPCERAAYLAALRQHPDWQVRRAGRLVLVRFPAAQPAGLRACP
ncbi:DUF2079 domain-containing protein [Luteipulveratus mongoliensis]|uniref:DUF2079 domain-containing protein n=1 Tax=Luteipulveratus mongoliensis TaxID=571913 RepID=A0A0K1JP32_9MICO|nr:DUF2079 domain-containing protein [Luteipulveratus mongoliensis]AKU18477.1 hypothetical protein VV02_25815 [Luteipulveratus mongoliensis]